MVCKITFHGNSTEGYFGILAALRLPHQVKFVARRPSKRFTDVKKSFLMSVLYERKYLTNFRGISFTIRFSFLDMSQFSSICFVVVLFNFRPS